MQLPRWVYEVLLKVWRVFIFEKWCESLVCSYRYYAWRFWNKRHQFMVVFCAHAKKRLCEHKFLDGSSLSYILLRKSHTIWWRVFRNRTSQDILSVKFSA